MNLQGKTILVTGANGGIGRAIVERLARQRASLILVGRDQQALRELSATVLSLGGDALVMVADLLQPAERQRIVAVCQALPHGLYGLVNNAGGNTFGLFAEQDEAMVQQQVTLNLLVPMLLTRALLPALHKASEARLLNIGSTFGSIGYPGYAPYCAAKFGLRGFTEALRRELADTPLKVLYLAPRATTTPLNTDRVVALNRELGNAMDTPDSVADAAVQLFLAGKPHQRFLGFPEKLFARINQILPVLVDGALRKQLAVIKRHARLR